MIITRKGHLPQEFIVDNFTLNMFSISSINKFEIVNNVGLTHDDKYS